MLKPLPQIFNKIKSKLLAQQRQIEKSLKKIEASSSRSEELVESSEPGTDSWLADVYTKSVAVKQNLIGLLQSTKQALQNLRRGNYGKCKKCGKQIELERLEAMPTATLCLSCSKRVAK